MRYEIHGVCKTSSLEVTTVFTMKLLREEVIFTRIVVVNMHMHGRDTRCREACRPHLSPVIDHGEHMINRCTCRVIS